MSYYEEILVLLMVLRSHIYHFCAAERERSIPLMTCIYFIKYIL